MIIQESLNTARKKYLETGKISQEMFDELLLIDKSSTKKYIEWICKMYLEDKNFDKEILAELLEEFEKHKSINIARDINTYTSIQDLQNKILKSVNDAEVLRANFKRGNLPQVEGAEIVFQNEKVLVYRINNKSASCELGAGTKWCISMKDESHYENYSKDYAIYFIYNLSKSSKDPMYKVAILVSWKEDTLRAYNADDSELQNDYIYYYLKKFKIPSNIFKPKDKTLEDFHIKNYIINADGTVDVDGDVYLSGYKIETIPFKFGKVSGNFSVSSNKLVSLFGSPISVGGTFDCSYNNIASLEHSPTTVNRHFVCSHSNLLSLVGAPQSVGGDFYCNENKFTSLQGAPKVVGGSFYCYDNNLISLQGAPQSVGGHFNCSNANLSSLEYITQNIGGSILCHNNNLTSLKYLPEVVYENFYCHNNDLQSLEYLPKIIYGNFWCFYNKIKFTERDVLSVCKVGGEIVV